MEPATRRKNGGVRFAGTMTRLHRKISESSPKTTRVNCRRKNVARLLCWPCVGNIFNIHLDGRRGSKRILSFVLTLIILLRRFTFIGSDDEEEEDDENNSPLEKLERRWYDPADYC